MGFPNATSKVVISVFDEQFAQRQHVVRFGFDRFHIGFWLQGPAGVFSSEDGRNPGASPQMLFPNGTGIDAGHRWLAIEDQPAGTGLDAEYADAVLSVEQANIDPVQRTSWGAVKARFG